MKETKNCVIVSLSQLEAFTTMYEKEFTKAIDKMESMHLGGARGMPTYFQFIFKTEKDAEYAKNRLNDLWLKVLI